MDRNITQQDLILYYYNECSAEIQDYISRNLNSHSEWQQCLIDLREIHSELTTPVKKGPSQTTLSIILEESLHQEDHSY